MTRRPHLLIVDDEEYVRESLSEIVRGEDMEATAVAGTQQALDVLATRAVDVVLTDLRMPSRDGHALLAETRRSSASIPVVVITGQGTVSDAVSAMKAGAHDFLQKPADPEQLLLVIRRALEHRRLVGEVRHLRGEVEQHRSRELAGSSPAMARVRDQVGQVAPADASVLICGESGTGKEVAATEIHRRSARPDGPLVRVNCAAIPETLFESELFGHCKGSFSGAVADRAGCFSEAEGGTLVLDEIATLPTALQPKLLRVLESGEYHVIGDPRPRRADVRVIAITNEDLSELVASGGFRDDLFYRLNVFPITMPPLREHPEDIPEIAASLLLRLRLGAWAAGQAVFELDEDSLQVLRAHTWPGNVRELRNALERALILSPSGPPDARTFRMILGAAGPGREDSAPETLQLRPRLEQLEGNLVREALDRCGGNRKEAAELLGIDPKNMGYYLRKHDLRGTPRKG